MQRLLAALLVVSLHGCSEPLPEPPDLSETIRAYEQGPTAEVPEIEVVDRLLSSVERTQLADELRKLNIIIEKVSNGFDLPKPPLPGTEPGDNIREGLRILEARFFVDLYAELVSDCPGFDPEETDPEPEETGTLNVALRLTESGFDGVFWGEFDRCRVLAPGPDSILGSNEVILDGPAALVLLDPLGFDVVRDYLFVFDGTIFIGDELGLDGALDFLVEQDVGTTVRIRDEQGGQVFLFQPVDSPFALELRTLSVSWGCDLEERQCLSTTGTRVSW